MNVIEFPIHTEPKVGYRVMASDIYPGILKYTIPVKRPWFCGINGEECKCSVIERIINADVSSIQEKHLFFVNEALKEGLDYLWYIEFVQYEKEPTKTLARIKGVKSQMSEPKSSKSKNK